VCRKHLSHPGGSVGRHAQGVKGKIYIPCLAGVSTPQRLSRLEAISADDLLSMAPSRNSMMGRSGCSRQQSSTTACRRWLVSPLLRPIACMTPEAPGRRGEGWRAQGGYALTHWREGKRAVPWVIALTCQMPEETPANPLITHIPVRPQGCLRWWLHTYKGLQRLVIGLHHR